MTRKLEDALRKQKKSTEQSNPEITGTLGIPLDGRKVVEVPGRKAFVYVKLRDNENEVIQAFNNKVAPSYGLPVIVEWQNNRYTVTAVNTARYQNNWNSYAPFLPAHGNTHSFDPDNGGGGDVVWVHSRQIMPLLVTPSGSSGAPNVIMASYVLKKDNGTWIYVGNTGTQSFSTYLPTSPTGAIMGLVYLNTNDGNPYVLINSGTVFPNSLTGTGQVVPYIPSLPSPATQIPLAAVRLITGTNQISWENIYDVRQWLHSTPTGTGGGGGSVITGTTIQDEGVDQGVVGTLNFVGAGVNASVAGGVATVTITGSSGGSNLTGTSAGLPNKLVLTNSSGFLNTHPGLAWGLVGSNPFIEFGANIPGKVFNAGYMGYNLFSTGYVEIIGAGTGSGDRWVRIYDNLKVDTHLQTNSFQHLGLLNTYLYLNATGTAVTPDNAPQDTVITGSHSVMGMRADTTSVQFTVNDLAEGIVYTDVIGAFLDGNTVPSSTTHHATPYRHGVGAGAGNFPWPDGGVISNMSIRTASAQPASGSLVITLYVNNVASSLVITIAAGSGNGTFSNNTNQVSISAADVIRWELANNASAASAQLTAISMKISKRATA